MDAINNFSLRFAQGSDAKAETAKRRTLQKIATGISLVSLAVGFSVLGMLITINRHQARLNDLRGGSTIATVGGISAIFVGTVFLVAACLRWRVSGRRSVAFSVSHRAARVTSRDPNQPNNRRADLIGPLLREKTVKDENHENGALRAPLIFTVPACGFVVALNLGWIDPVGLAVWSTSAQEN